MNVHSPSGGILPTPAAEWESLPVHGNAAVVMRKHKSNTVVPEVTVTGKRITRSIKKANAGVEPEESSLGSRVAAEDFQPNAAENHGKYNESAVP